METIDLKQKFSLFKEHWSPHLLGDVNDCCVKIAKFQGEFDWHAHDNEDEMFLVVQGEITIELRDRTLRLGPGQMAIIPQGVEHKPAAADEAWVLMFEPKSTVNTGNIAASERTVTDLPSI